MSGLERWIEEQCARSAEGLLKSISPSAIIKTRPHFSQTIIAKKGSVVASPVLAAYDPDPDYFFHWYRDSALVMDALRILYEDGSCGARALTHLSDFVEFSLSLNGLDGRAGRPPRAAPGFEKFLRRDLLSAHGEAIPAETRVNPDGTLDMIDWPRPQHDGPALRALTLLRWTRATSLPGKTERALSALLHADLAFVAAHARRTCFDIWEEEKGLHYYTMRVSAAALAEGALWLEKSGAAGPAQIYAAEAQAILRQLDLYWRAEGYYGSRECHTGARSAKDLDIAVILSAIHTNGEGAHSPHDARMQATLAKLVALFEDAYAINRDRPPGRGAAMGRYAGDTYYSGGAYYFATLGAAEFCFRAGWAERGDGFLETVRVFSPASGDLSEQFDQTTGAQTSARQLAWSYAAFISCIAARRVPSLRARSKT